MTRDVRITVPVAKVLAAFLADPAEDRYGLELMEVAELPSGTLYPILTRLQQAGWVESHWEEVDPAVAGRPARRYYRLTADGVVSAHAAIDSLPRLAPAKPASPATRPAWGGMAMGSAW
jgi:DNA-binding IclR family transcriptional regulator